MRSRRLAGVVAVVALAAVMAPASALGHASLLRTAPSPQGTIDTAPTQVALTYSEAVEPRFAVISVTNAAGDQETSGLPHRSATDADEIDTPVHHLPEGWYLVYWRVISADGHPVRGAFTFAVGPDPGPSPKFVIPSLSESAATTPLIAARWLVLLSVMIAVGLLVLRLLIARPLGRGPSAAALRPLVVAFAAALVVALVAVPVYAEMTTATFAQQSALDIGSVVSLIRTSSFGRALVDLEVVLALFGVAATAALLLDQPQRALRSVVELLSGLGAGACVVALLTVPGLAGHAAQTSPAALALTLDVTHLMAGSVWLGGLVGVLVLWISLDGERRPLALGVVVPRFSRVALGSVLVLIATGTWAAVLHLPTLSSLWQTSYGEAILVKIGLLTATTMVGAVNLLTTTPRLAAASLGGRPDLGRSGARLLRRTVSVEILLVAATVVAAATLTSLPPPPKSLASLGGVSAHIGPGAVRKVVDKFGYRFAFAVSPNRAALPNAFQVAITRGGQPLRGATVIAHFSMLDMEMGTQAYILRETSPGTYVRSEPALVMVGHWGLDFQITPRGGTPFDVTLVDTTSG